MARTFVGVMIFAMELGTHRFFSSRASPFSAGVLEGIGFGFGHVTVDSTSRRTLCNTNLRGHTKVQKQIVLV